MNIDAISSTMAQTQSSVDFTARPELGPDPLWGAVGAVFLGLCGMALLALLLRRIFPDRPFDR